MICGGVPYPYSPQLICWTLPLPLSPTHKQSASTQSPLSLAFAHSSSIRTIFLQARPFTCWGQRTSRGRREKAYGPLEKKGSLVVALVARTRRTWWWCKVFEREHVFYFGSPPAPTLPVSFPLATLSLPSSFYFFLHRPPFAFEKKWVRENFSLHASRL